MAPLNGEGDFCHWPLKRPERKWILWVAALSRGAPSPLKPFPLLEPDGVREGLGVPVLDKDLKKITQIPNGKTSGPRTLPQVALTPGGVLPGPLLELWSRAPCICFWGPRPLLITTLPVEEGS